MANHWMISRNKKMVLLEKKKIVILSDIFRLDKWLDENIDIFYNLFSYQAEIVSGIKPYKFYEMGFDIYKFLSLNNIAVTNLSKMKKIERIKIWQQLLTEDITQEAKNYLVSFLQDSFVISYHCNEVINDILTEAEIPFIDFFETSLRFMPDTFLGLRSNNIEIQNYTLSKQMPLDNLYLYAAQLKALSIRNTKVKIQANSMLLINQTAYDYTMLKQDKTFDKITNYAEIIKEQAKKYSVLYYKLHPKEKNNKEINKFFKSIKNAKKINADMYSLLSNDNIKLVTGINSGSLYEAKYFNKDVLFLGEKKFQYSFEEKIKSNNDTSLNNVPYNVNNISSISPQKNFSGNCVNKNTFVLLESNDLIFTSSFWQKILSPFFNVNRDASFNLKRPLENNFLRLIINSSDTYSLNTSKNINILQKQLKKSQIVIKILISILLILILVMFYN